MMKVITLNKNNFEEACNALADKIYQEGDIDALVGVRTGGAIVAHLICESLQKRSYTVKYFEAGASRYGTVAKSTGAIKVIFRFLPKAILNTLRIVEHYLVVLKMKLFKSAERSIAFDDELVDYLNNSVTGKVCIVDDAIDSGATVKNILEKCYSINPSLEYKVAVLVVTQNGSILLPDICIYKNVLLRFPWSNDFKL